VKLPFLNLITLGTSVLSSIAGATTFTDKDAFLAMSANAIEHTSGIVRPTKSPIYFSNKLTISRGPLNITMRSRGPLNMDKPPSLDTELPPSGYYSVGVSGVENLNFNFEESRLGFGLSIYEPTGSSYPECNAPCVQSTFTFTFKKSGVVVGQETFSPTDDQKVFFGVILNNTFDSVEMRETIQGTTLTGDHDNEFFGEFVSTTDMIECLD